MAKNKKEAGAPFSFLIKSIVSNSYTVNVANSIKAADIEEVAQHRAGHYRAIEGAKKRFGEGVGINGSLIFLGRLPCSG